MSEELDPSISEKMPLRRWPDNSLASDDENDDKRGSSDGGAHLAQNGDISTNINQRARKANHANGNLQDTFGINRVQLMNSSPSTSSTLLSLNPDTQSYLNKVIQNHNNNNYRNTNYNFNKSNNSNNCNIAINKNNPINTQNNSSPEQVLEEVFSAFNDCGEGGQGATVQGNRVFRQCFLATMETRKRLLLRVTIDAIVVLCGE